MRKSSEKLSYEICNEQVHNAEVLRMHKYAVFKYKLHKYEMNKYTTLKYILLHKYAMHSFNLFGLARLYFSLCSVQRLLETNYNESTKGDMPRCTDKSTKVNSERVNAPAIHTHTHTHTHTQIQVCIGTSFTI